MSLFANLKSYMNHERNKIALNEIKKIAKQNPKKFVFDVFTTFGTAKSFESNVIVGNKIFNELGLHRYRVKKAAELSEKRRNILAKFLDPVDVQQFQKNGFILKENFLADHEFELISNELLNTALPTRETLQGDTVTRRMSLDAKSLKSLPHTHQLLNQASWKNLINYVGSFKVQPMYYVQVILSHVRKSRPDPQTNLHSDTFHPSVKAWLFLTDVAEDEGPFVYVPGSHIVNKQRLEWEHTKANSLHSKSDKMSLRGSFRIRPEELKVLGYNEPKAFAVEKNTLVIADTYGFHARGASVRPSTRIELWAYARRSPFIPWVGLNPLNVPVLRTRLIPIYWSTLDYLEDRFKRNNPWKKVGKKYATDAATIIKK